MAISDPMILMVIPGALLVLSVWFLVKACRGQAADAGDSSKSKRRASCLAIAGMSQALALAMIFGLDYIVKPENWSFEKLLANVGGPRHYRSWTEIKRRLGLRQLSETQQRGLLDRCLQVVEEDPANISTYDPAWHVMGAIRSGQLPPERAERFFSSMLSANLVVSPAEAGPGDAISYRVDLAWKRNPGSLSCYTEIEARPFIIDDLPSSIDCVFRPSNDPRTGSHQAALPFDEPGWHTIALPLQVTIYDNMMSPQNPRHVLYHRTITVPGNRFHIQGRAGAGSEPSPASPSKPNLRNGSATIGPEADSKLDKARELGVEVIDEAEFRRRAGVS